jgi:hypothetical protein
MRRKVKEPIGLNLVSEDLDDIYMKALRQELDKCLAIVDVNYFHFHFQISSFTKNKVYLHWELQQLPQRATFHGSESEAPSRRQVYNLNFQ